MRFRDRLWNPYMVVFLSNACIMVLELVASRLIAPRLGVSLYTWTSVIGVILAGISIGNYLGGRLADRYASPFFLGVILALASLGSLSILALTNALSNTGLSDNLPLLISVVVYIAALFLLPSLILGCVSPIVVKLSLTDLQRTGTTVGKIYAWSSVGSIVGTFATGFWLIAWFGTRTVVLLVSGVLLLMAVWFLTDIRRWRASAMALVAVLLFGGAVGLLYRGGDLQRECLLETNYFCIKVHDKEVGDTSVRELVLDRLVHSYSDIEDPTHLVYGYERTYAEVIRPMLPQRPDLSALFIGGGGYTFPRYLEALVPHSRLVVAEIDPGVTAVAHALLGLPRDTRTETHSLDARILLANHDMGEQFDLVFGDAFNDYSVPFHLTTLEFNRLVADLLHDDGMYMVNIVDGGRHGRFLRAFVHTLREVFAHVEVIPSGSDWRDSVRTTFVIVASKQPVDLSHLPVSERPLEPEELEEYLAMEDPIILTDEYVPVDNLLAPVFRDSHDG
jgi:spermidine synthase